MKHAHVLLLLVLVLYAPLAFAQSIRLAFSQTEVSEIFRVLSLKTGANIVYSVKEKLPVSLTVDAGTVDEAVKSVVSAAGLSYRKVERTYVVAKPDTMKQALEPFTSRHRLNVPSGMATEAAKFLSPALPHASIMVVGDSIHIAAVHEDYMIATGLLKQYLEQPSGGQTDTEVVRLRFATSEGLTSALESVFPGLKAYGLGDPKAPGGAIALTGSRDQILAAREMIARLDVEDGSIGEGGYAFYKIKYSSAPALLAFLGKAMPEVRAYVGPETYLPANPSFRPLSGATLGTKGGSGTGSSGSGDVQATGAGSQIGSSEGLQGGSKPVMEGDRATTLVLRGPKPVLDSAIALLAEMDTRPLQVMVEVKVVEVSPTFSEQLGVNWSWLNFRFYEVPAGSAFTGFPPGSEFTQFITKPVGLGQFSRVPWGINALLSALVTRKEAKIIASPSVQVLDNDEANIFIGDTIRARVSTATGLGAQTVEIVEFPVGIILLIRPRVNADGDITMRVHPVVSTVTDIDSQNVPQTAAREAETTVMVKDGETMVIGGLVRDEFSKTISEVPFLSKLPIVGELFRNRTTSKRRTEVLVFITPRLIKQGTPAAPQPGKDDKDK